MELGIKRFARWFHFGALIFAVGWLVTLPRFGAFHDAAAYAGPPARSERLSTSKKSPGFSTERFVRVFRTGREDLRLKTLAEAEQHSSKEPELSVALWEVIQHDLQSKRFSDSFFAAIQLHGRLAGADVVEHQTSLLTAVDPRVVLLAVNNLGTLRATTSLQPLLNVKKRADYQTHYGLRHSLVSAVSQIRDPASIDFLVATVGKADGQLKFEAARQLTHLTGQNLGGKADAWQSWWKENQDSFSFANLREKPAFPAQAAVPKAAMEWDYPVPMFYDTPVYAKRVVFVIDQSRSMLSSVDGVTRLDEAQRQLEAAIRKLPEDAWFEVLAYDASVTPWQGHLVPATANMRADAIRFAYSLNPMGKTAC